MFQLRSSVPDALWATLGAIFFAPLLDIESGFEAEFDLTLRTISRQSQKGDLEDTER